MAISIISDQIKGSSQSVNALSGSAIRLIVITGVENVLGVDVLNNALNDPLVPAIGDAFPTPTTGRTPPEVDGINMPFQDGTDTNYVLYDKTIQALSNDNNTKFLITCNYGIKDCLKMPPLTQNTEPSATQAYANKNVSTTLQSFQTTELIETGGIAETPDTIDLFRQNQTPSSKNKPNQTALVSIQKPVTVVTFTRHEDADPQGSTNSAHLGKVNETDFMGGANAGEWLFTALNGTTNNGGLSYVVTYEFQSQGSILNGGGWETTVVYTDADTGLPLLDAQDNSPDDRTKRTYDSYNTFDFTGFELEP